MNQDKGQLKLVKRTITGNCNMTGHIKTVSFIARRDSELTRFWNTADISVVENKMRIDDIPRQDYAGPIFIHMRGNNRPPIVMMANDDEIAHFIDDLGDDTESSLLIDDMGGMNAIINKDVISYIELPHAQNGLKALRVAQISVPEFSDEPDLVPQFYVDSYCGGVATHETSEGIKRTPMKYKSWRAKIRRQYKRRREQQAAS